MQIVVLSNAALKEELLQDTTDTGAELIWIEDAKGFSNISGADAYIDLLFDNSTSRKSILKHLLPKPVIVNSVVHTLEDIGEPFIRIGAWPTFLKGNVIEAACRNEDQKERIETVFKHFGKVVEWLPDVPGFVTPRVVSMIINEAHFALEEGVSTKEEIDTAMQLGTAYPYGPFTWCQKIGVPNIVALLQKLSATQPRCTPAPLLGQAI